MKLYIIIGLIALVALIYILVAIGLAWFVIKNSKDDKPIKNIRDIILGAVVAFTWPVYVVQFIIQNFLTYLVNIYKEKIIKK
jgi:amino acid transporter